VTGDCGSDEPDGYRSPSAVGATTPKRLADLDPSHESARFLATSRSSANLEREVIIDGCACANNFQDLRRSFRPECEAVTVLKVSLEDVGSRDLHPHSVPEPPAKMSPRMQGG